MTTTIKAVVRYHGSKFAGWQVQPGQRTVQGVIEDALTTIAGEPIRIMGSGRTDAGVHALAQVFSCAWPEPLDAPKLRRSLCSMLGPELRIESLEEAAADFHALNSAIGKRYAYCFSLARHPDPFTAETAWCIPWEVDPETVSRLARQLTGEHDFAGFCSAGSSVKTTTRTIYSIDLHEGPVVGPDDARSHWHLEFHGNGFLYKMVRNITGTVIDIARGQVEESRLDDLLRAPAPYLGFTAPGHGLFLKEVVYPD